MIPRVTLDDLFPNATIGHEPECLLVFLSAFTDVCWVCGNVTPWVSLSFESHVCSMVCEDIGWNRFRIASAKSAGDPLWGPT